MKYMTMALLIVLAGCAKTPDELTILQLKTNLDSMLTEWQAMDKVVAIRLAEKERQVEIRLAAKERQLDEALAKAQRLTRTLDIKHLETRNNKTLKDLASHNKLALDKLENDIYAMYIDKLKYYVKELDKRERQLNDAGKATRRN